jgi:hypothetical protein
MNRECINCKNPITRGLLCPGCAAVADICTHFAAYVVNQDEMRRLLDDLERHGVVTAEGLHALADSRAAVQMKGLGLKCIESERLGGAGAFNRAMIRLRRDSKPAPQAELAGILGSVTRAVRVQEHGEKPDRNGTLSIYD